MEEKIIKLISASICLTMGNLALQGKVRETYDFSDVMARNIYHDLNETGCINKDNQ